MEEKERDGLTGQSGYMNSFLLLNEKKGFGGLWDLVGPRESFIGLEWTWILGLYNTKGPFV